MAVTVNQGLCVLPIELKFPSAGGFFLDDEFFEKKGRLRNIDCVRTINQVRILVPERQDATRFTTDNRIAVFNECMKLTDIEGRVLSGLLGKALRNHRP